MLKYMDFYSRGLDLCFTEVKSKETLFRNCYRVRERLKSAEC